MTNTWPPAQTPPVTTPSVTAGTPEPYPDCTGEYELFEYIDGYPRYRRNADWLFFIYLYHVETDYIWVLAENLNPYLAVSLWYQDPEKAPGIFKSGDEPLCTGQPLLHNIRFDHP